MTIPIDQQSPYPGGQHAAPAIPDSQVDTPANTATPEPAPDPDEELWKRATVLKFFGGEKPLHVSTLYRGIDAGIYPPPINVSPNSVRWSPHECRAARQRMFSERANPKPPTRRGRPRRFSIGTDNAAA